MRQLVRTNPNSKVISWLARQTTAIQAETTLAKKKTKAKSLWGAASKGKKQALRLELESMAPARVRCCYCHDSEATSIDHFWPKSTYPALTFTWTNLLLACPTCNSNLKRDVFPLDMHSRPMLVDPSSEDPFEHLSIDLALGEFIPITSRGNTTLDVFQLRRQTLIKHRTVAMKTIVCLTRATLDARRLNDSQQESRLLELLSLIEPDYIRQFVVRTAPQLVGVPSDVASALASDAGIRQAISSGLPP